MTANFADDGSTNTFENRESCRKMISDLRQLEGLVKQLSEKAVKGPVDGDELLGSLSKVSASVDGLGEYARYWTEAWVFPTYCPPHAAGLAQQVFDIPELLEMVLAYLDMDDLLAAQFISRQFRDAVEGSKPLQHKLSLLPHTSQDFYAPFAHIKPPGLQLVYDLPRERVFLRDPTPAERKAMGDKTHCKAMQLMFDERLPKIGSRCRRMLVCQPPIKKMMALPNCCTGVYPKTENGERVGIRTVQSADGITVGDLVDAAGSIRALHRNCPYAAFSMHDLTDGHVKMQVVFQAWVCVRGEDPEVVAKRLHTNEQAVGTHRRDPRERLVRAFMAEKRDACANGEDIPLFEEFAENFKPE